MLIEKRVRWWSYFLATEQTSGKQLYKGCAVHPVKGNCYKAIKSSKVSWVRYEVLVFYIAITVTETFSEYERHQHHHAKRLSGRKGLLNMATSIEETKPCQSNMWKNHAAIPTSCPRMKIKALSMGYQGTTEPEPSVALGNVMKHEVSPKRLPPTPKSGWWNVSSSF